MGDNLINWGFEPIGTPLGSEGALSMPLGEATGLENPLTTTENMLSNFSEQTQRRYGDVSDPNGSVWDPRGDRALSDKVADYRDTDMMRPDEIPVSISDMSPELMGGEPVLAPYAASNQLDPTALHEAGLGLSDVGAATLADSLSVYDPKILDAIHIPPQVEPKIVNEVGLVTDHGGLPDAFFDSSSGVLHKGIPEAVDNVIRQQGEYQYVDDNGVVDKYPYGTGPYDSPGFTRPGTLVGALPGTPIRSRTGTQLIRGRRRFLTPADIASSPRLAMRAAMGQVPGTAPGGSPFTNSNSRNTLSSAVQNQMRNANQQGGPSGDLVKSTGAETPATPPVSDPSFNSGGASATGGAPVYDPSVDAGQGQGQGQGLAQTGGFKCPSWWQIAVGMGLAGIGTYLLVRKGKKGKK